ncbi:hypothetical protein EGW08_001177 [Elysia chlorotica]|uniref:TMC domain-containing protein n=1 Tax=Elysia chlorotica TaxID=188477 RepID=A0A3S1A0Y4_ELYCH|nr:hypothetical protein EGW08_001177 [Elysia chlorotica]
MERCKMAEGGEETLLLSGVQGSISYGASIGDRSVTGHRETALGIENLGFVSQHETFPDKNPNSSGPGDFTPDSSDTTDKLSPEFNKPRHTSKEELLFNLKFAHLHLGTDWFNEIVASAASDPDGPHILHQVKAALKDFPLTMSEKKELSQRLKHFIEMNKNSDGNEMSAFNASSKTFDSSLRSAHNIAKGSGSSWMSGLASTSENLLPSKLWNSNITKISAYFGSYVAYHFRFLRFPGDAEHPSWCHHAGLCLPPARESRQHPNFINGGFDDSDVHEGFLGKMTETVFFYGAFHERSSGHHVVLQLTAGLLSHLVLRLLHRPHDHSRMLNNVANIIFLRSRRIKQTDFSRENPYSCYVLTGWDFCLTNEDGSKLRSRALTTRLRVLTFRVLGHLFYLGLLGACAYLIVMVTQTTLLPDDFVSRELSDFVRQYELAVLAMAMKVCIPPVLSFLLRFEYYSPRTQVKIELGKPNFEVSPLNPDLLYSQCLVWLGLYFMPLLPLLVAFDQVIIFYLTYFISMNCLVEPQRVFRASRSGTFDLFVLAASLFLCMMPMAVGIVELEPSSSCGLYRPDVRVYDSLVAKIDGLPGWLRETVGFVGTLAFALPVIVVLLILVLYYHAKYVSHKQEAETLRGYLNYKIKVENRRMVALSKDNKEYIGTWPRNRGGAKKDAPMENNSVPHVESP